MKTAELLEELGALQPLVQPDIEEEIAEAEAEVDGPIFEEDDLWEAIDFLQSCRKCNMAVLKYAEGLSGGRRRIIENLNEDIRTFVANFVEESECESGTG
jgi:hypothetical protein